MTPPPAALSPQETTRLVEFARACKTALRAVTMYPEGHQATDAPLARMVALTTPEALPSPLTLTVLPDGLLLDERMPARPEAIVTQFAALLHTHRVGQLTVKSGGDADAWRRFLLLVARTPDSVRTDGGIARVWTAMAGRHVDVREIDYVEALRERAQGTAAEWHRLITACLKGDRVELDPDASAELVEAARDGERIAQLVRTMEHGDLEPAAPAEEGPPAILQMLRSVVDIISRVEPDLVESVLRRIAQAAEKLSPDALLDVIRHVDEDKAEELVRAFIARMSDAALQRLQGVQGAAEGAEDAERAAAVELLARARERAILVDRAGDDPPERVHAWLGTIDPSAIRGLDLQLVTDLLRMESDADRWGELMTPVGSLLNDLLLVGDFDGARRLVSVLLEETRRPESYSRQAIEELLIGPLVEHVPMHSATVDDGQVETIVAISLAVGERLARPLSEALALDDHMRVREVLTALVRAYGPIGRRTVDKMKASDDPAIRRAAVDVLRRMGSGHALTELAALLGDAYAPVQQDALRALLDIGSDKAYGVIEQALAEGDAARREQLIQSVCAIRDPRIVRILAYVLQQDGAFTSDAEYVRTIDSLGALRDPAAIAPLREVLYDGRWWAPRQTAARREAAASALARIGTDEAMHVLQTAAAGGPRGARAAAKERLDAIGVAADRPLQQGVA